MWISIEFIYDVYMDCSEFFPVELYFKWGTEKVNVESNFLQREAEERRLRDHHESQLKNLHESLVKEYKAKEEKIR